MSFDAASLQMNEKFLLNKHPLRFGLPGLPVERPAINSYLAILFGAVLVVTLPHVPHLCLTPLELTKC